LVRHVKILIPIFGFGAQGGYRVLSRLATEWRKQGVEVDFLVPEGSDQPYFETTGTIRRAKTDGTMHSGSSECEPMRGKNRFRALLKALRTIANDYDVYFANQAFTPWLLLGAGVPERKRVYYIQAYEPDFFDPAKQPVHWSLAKLSYGIPALRIVNAPLYRRYKGIKAEHWVPPGIDLSVFGQRPIAKAAETFTVGCIGRHEPDKGITYLLQAFERLHAIDARYRLSVAFGNLPDNWQHPAAEIVAVKGDGQLADFYRSLDVLVAPGTIQHGAVHYPVMEAMACGVPVATTGYLPATPDNAWIIANRDADSIVDAVRMIDQDQDRHTRIARGIQDVQAFAWDRVAAQMLALLLKQAA
jgi:glycosyltransferase involved in cell wall biosynthesis